MVVAILIQTISQVVTKIALNGGINTYVLAFYSYALSSFLLLPFIAFLFHRSQAPPLNFSSICRFFLLAIFGSSGTVLAYVGLDLSSPTMAAALLNLIPAFTFVLALIFRMEIVDFGEKSSQAKVLGTIVSIGGAFVVIFYKGPPIFKNHSSASSYKQVLSLTQSNWVLGGFYLATESFIASLWYIYQASVIKSYPSVMVVVFFQILFSTILSAIFAIIVVADLSAWVLRLDMGLVCIIYQAVVAVVIRFILYTWSVKKAGPLFCTMFKPVGIIFTVIMGALFLGDDFHLGSLVGAVIIVLGFYAVIWGKAKEERKAEARFENLESSCHTAPLLQNKT
ncbi:WAT1-related protein At5g40240 [Neltuma alba]|uniref:WAT1-related protein At5g40240 n=1 Tax=Neltuma alba TaxID=207710 RepID=UPI0010A3AAE3|nr:WAT1-related protein At5g40240-like [Prosopis alba]